MLEELLFNLYLFYGNILCKGDACQVRIHMVSILFWPFNQLFENQRYNNLFSSEYKGVEMTNEWWLAHDPGAEECLYWRLQSRPVLGLIRQIKRSHSGHDPWPDAA